MTPAEVARCDPARAPGAARVVCVASGKGGVGKTSVAVNLGLTLARRGLRVMLLDADLALANVDVALGLQASANLEQVFDGDCCLDDIILNGPHGLRIVPAGSGVRRLTALSPAEHAGLVAAFSELREPPQVLLIDSAAGMADSVLSFGCASHEIVLVVCDEPASMTDAYALIKVMSRECGLRRFRILANRVNRAQAGQRLFNQLLRVTERFLDVRLDFLGAIPEDRLLQRSVRARSAVVEAFPDSPSAEAFRRVADRLERSPCGAAASGGLQFFFERLVAAEGVAR